MSDVPGECHRKSARAGSAVPASPPREGRVAALVVALGLASACGARSSEDRGRPSRPIPTDGGNEASAASCEEPAVPPSLAAAQSSSVVVRFGERGGCSATRVGHDLLLTAAHCRVGYSGDEDLGAPWFERNGQRFALRVVEAGQFRPDAGKMADWLLVSSDGEGAPFEGIGVADLASRADIERRVASVSDEPDDRSAALWAITYPLPSYRQCPRPPFLGGRVSSRGYLKSDVAYRKSVALALAARVVYDDRDDGEAPAVPADFEAQWAAAPQSGPRDMFERYRADGDPLLFHSADFAPGSSGGGIFDEATGKLLGIVVFGSTVVSRRDTYGGIDAMYRIDAICSRSRVLECPEPAPPSPSE